MIDVDHLKGQFDCRQIVERDLGKPRYHGRDYISYKCPFHNEAKGYSLVVYADHWRCYGKCQTSGDVIGWLIHYHGLSFPAACQHLSGGDPPTTARPLPREPPPERFAEPPDDLWQQVANRIAEAAADRLWGTYGRRAFTYLHEQRGLTKSVIAEAQLGFIPGAPDEWLEIEGLRVPCGITFPWYTDGALWGIKVRRAAGERRYQQVSGGNLRGSLYLADKVEPGLPLLITEGEIDALTAWQLSWGKLSVVSIGSASHARINPRWHGNLLAAPEVLVCLDNDKAGHSAARELMASVGTAQIIHVPQKKDINSFYSATSKAQFMCWLMDII